MQTYEYYKRTYGYIPLFKNNVYSEPTGLVGCKLPVSMNAYLSALAITTDRTKKDILIEALEFFFKHNDVILNEKYRGGESDLRYCVQTEEYDLIYGKYSDKNIALETKG